MEYIKEHLYITFQNGVYFLNADNGYKFYDSTSEERTYWTKCSLGFDRTKVNKFEVIDEETASEIENKEK